MVLRPFAKIGSDRALLSRFAGDARYFLEDIKNGFGSHINMCKVVSIGTCNRLCTKLLCLLDRIDGNVT